MPRWWMSWNTQKDVAANHCDPPHEAILGWWSQTKRGRLLFHALVEAPDSDSAWRVVESEIPELQRIFCDRRSARHVVQWDAFPLLNWMAERMGLRKRLGRCKCGNPATTNGYCRSCRKIQQKAWYAENRAAQIARASECNSVRRSGVRRLIAQAKAKPCSDCGHTFPSVCMDFDHVRGKKRFTIGQYAANYSTEEIQEEIGKCDVVCANCHRIRTARRLIKKREVTA